MLTPYAPSVNTRMVGYFRDHGVGIVAAATFDRRDDREAARISATSIARAAEQLATKAGVDAIFVSCTSLRIAHAVNAIETDLGVPITSSNHAMAWHCLRLAGIKDAPASGGRLFQQQRLA
jgi:maleate isomerase